MELQPIPSYAQAQQYLVEAEFYNPGPWVQHSIIVAQGASLIAERHPRLDPQRAYILGCLHDIGQRAGVHGIRHIIDGYRFMAEEGYPGVGRICLTHSYPAKDKLIAASPWDGTDEDLDFVRDYLQRIEYDDYDRLILLCDAVSLPSGFSLMEKRLVDVALRYGVDEHTVARWQGFFAIKSEIESAIGISIYRILPGVVEHTFGWTDSLF